MRLLGLWASTVWTQGGHLTSILGSMSSQTPSEPASALSSLLPFAGGIQRMLPRPPPLPELGLRVRSTPGMCQVESGPWHQGP